MILIITGIALSSLYRQAVERTFDRRLNLYLRTLVAEVATPDEPVEKTAAALGEPLFELPLSGWYWQIVRVDAGPSTPPRASHSLWDSTLPDMQETGAPPTATGVRLGYIQGPEDQELRIIERVADLGSDGRYRIAVAGDATEIFDEIRTFNIYLAGDVSRADRRAAAHDHFSGALRSRPAQREFRRVLQRSARDTASGLRVIFLLEIAPLARETNALLEANREIVERARTHVGNLAHAIKTPLSVIVNERKCASRRSGGLKGSGAG